MTFLRQRADAIIIRKRVRKTALMFARPSPASQLHRLLVASATVLREVGAPLVIPVQISNALLSSPAANVIINSALTNMVKARAADDLPRAEAKARAMVAVVLVGQIPGTNLSKPASVVKIVTSMLASASVRRVGNALLLLP